MAKENCVGCQQRVETHQARMAVAKVQKPLNWFKGTFPEVHPRHVQNFLKSMESGDVEPVETDVDGNVIRGHGKVSLARLAGVEFLFVVVK